MNMNNNINNDTGFNLYDPVFIEMLRTLDPAEVNEELLLAANKAMIEQQGKRAHQQKASSSSSLFSATTATENDADAVSSSSSVSTSSSDNDDNDDDDASSSSSSSSSNNNTDAAHSGDDVATAFCRSFLSPDGAVEHFVRDLRSTAHTLQSLRATIRRFGRRIDGVASEVGVLQAKARETERLLINTHNVRQLTTAALERLVPALDMVRIVGSAVSSADENATATSHNKSMATDLPELGGQFVLSVRMLEKLLLARQSRIIQICAAQHNDDHDDGDGDGDEKKKNQEHSSSSSHATADSSLLFLDLRQAARGNNLDGLTHRVVDSLARQTCLHVRNFIVPRIATLLGKPRTNIAIQQRTALLPYRALVRFLKTCATSPELFRPTPAASAAEFSSSEQQHETVTAAEAASAFYEEVRATYTHFLSCVYVGNFQTYLSECLLLQVGGAAAAAASSASPAVHSAAGAGSAGSGSGWLDNAASWFGGSGGNSNSSSSGHPTGAGAHKGSSSISTASAFPSFADASSSSSNILPSEFSNRVNAATVRSVQAMLTATPILPIVQRAARKLHSALETFRSIHVLLCDVVTSEFLFSFEFFDGDTDVYAAVFRPVVDLYVQFVMRHFVPHQQQNYVGSSRSQQHSSSSSTTTSFVHEKDAVALGILTLMTVSFRRRLHERGLHCLDDYFSNVLALLLPCTKRALEIQHMSLRSLMTATATTASPKPSSSQQQYQATLDMLLRHSGGGGGKPASQLQPQQKLQLLARIHPVTERFAHFSFSLRTLLLRMSARYSDEKSENNASSSVPLPALGGGTAAAAAAFDADDSAEMLKVICTSAHALVVDALEWLRGFSRFLVLGARAPASPTATVAGDQQRQQQQPLLLPIDAIFIANNAGAILNLWSELGFPAHVEEQKQQQQHDHDDDDEDGNHHHHHDIDPATLAAENTDPQRSFVVSVDQEIFAAYDGAVESVAYDLLQHLMGDVILAVRNVEVDTQNHLFDHDEDDSSSKEAAAAVDDELQKKQQARLEAAAKRFHGAAKDLLPQIAAFCRNNLVEFSSSSADSSVSPALLRPLVPAPAAHPQLDVMKRTFTQLLLWNTRLHAALGAVAGAGQQKQQQLSPQQQQQLPARYRTIAVSNVQLTSWMQQVL